MFEALATRRLQTIGIMERKHASLRVLMQSMLKYTYHFGARIGGEHDKIGKAYILPRVTYLSNTLYGRKKMNSFELVRRSTPSNAYLPQSQVSD